MRMQRAQHGGCLHCAVRKIVSSSAFNAIMLPSSCQIWSEGASLIPNYFVSGSIGMEGLHWSQMGSTRLASWVREAGADYGAASKDAQTTAYSIYEQRMLQESPF